MEIPENYSIPAQVTVRFTTEQQQFINENIKHLVGDELEITRNQLFVKALTLAVSKSTPKIKEVEVVKDNPEQLQEIETLKAENSQLAGELETALSDLATKSNLPADAIILNLAPKDRQYFWGVLQLMKRDNKLKTYEELLFLMFSCFHARKEFTYTPEDINYLNTLDYDGSATDSGAEKAE